jgi:superfamily II RNA helicase
MHPPLSPPEEPAVDDDAILDRFVDVMADRGFELYEAQEEAMLELFDGRHVILNTPTGSGNRWLRPPCFIARSVAGNARFTPARSRPS